MHPHDRARHLLIGIAAAVTLLVLPPETFIAAFIFTMAFLGMAVRLAKEPLEDERVQGIVESLCRKAALPMPALRYNAASEIFASARGVRPSKRKLVLSEGALALSDEELTAVVAHELGHWDAWDMADAIVWLPAVIAMFHGSGEAAEWVYQSLNLQEPLRGNLTAATYVLPGFLLALACLATNRWAEERADRFAVALTGDVEALARVLDRFPEGGSWPEVLRTHPCPRVRIQKLRAATGGALQGETAKERDPEP